MPTGDMQLLEILFFERCSAGSIHVTQDPILGSDEVWMWVEARVEEGNGNAAPTKDRVRIYAGGCGQELLFVARIHWEWREQFGLERGRAARLNRFLNGLLNTFWANAILRLPTRIGLTQNARDVIFKFGLDGKKVWVK
jgi:hypothetical protein